MRRRTPACGSEQAHGPHEYADDYWPHGAKMRHRDKPGHCAGWTQAEADLCDMLGQVHLAMVEKNPPDGSKKFRLEVTPMVMAGLAGLGLPDDADQPLTVMVFGAELLCVIQPDAGFWRLSEVRPVVEGRARV
jgi:hypothetical protein